MAHLPYADPTRPDVQALTERIVAERGSLLTLYRMLLHSPPLASGWLACMTQVRHHLLLAGDLRELVIMRIAHLNGAAYEADQHAPIALREGLSQAQLDTLADWQAAAALFTPLQQAALQLADTMTQKVQVPREQIATLRDLLGDEQRVVELVGTIAAYNMVSRFLEALQVHSADDAPH